MEINALRTRCGGWARVAGTRWVGDGVNIGGRGVKTKRGNHECAGEGGEDIWRTTVWWWKGKAITVARGDVMISR